MICVSKSFPVLQVLGISWSTFCSQKKLNPKGRVLSCTAYQLLYCRKGAEAEVPPVRLPQSACDW